MSKSLRSRARGCSTACVGVLLLAGCEHDPLPAAGGGGAGFVADTYVGQWIGTWTNTTSNSSGPATLVVTRTDATLEATIDLGGDPLGSGELPAETFVATIGTSSATLSPERSPIFGQVSGRLDADGTVNATAEDVPGGTVRRFTLMGQWISQSLDVEATLTYEAGISPGTARTLLRLTKQ